MTRGEISFWNFTSIAVFIALAVLCVRLIRDANGFVILAGFTPFDFLLVSLAAFRFAHLLTYDKVFSFARRFFLDESREGGVAPARVASRVVYEMLECLWCTGIWSALIVVTVYTLGLWGQFAVIVLAAAGVGSLLQVVSKAVMKEHA